MSRQFALTGAPALLFGISWTATASDEQPRFELMHLWRVGIEAHALDAIKDPLKQRGVNWSEHLISGNFSDVSAEYEERLSLGVPPSGVFWIGGGSSAKLVDDGIFRLINDDQTADSHNFSDTLLPEIHDLIAYGNGISALPLGIHLQNHAIYNQAILQELNLPVPSSWQQFLEIAPRVQEAGYYPLSMSDERWQLQFLLIAILAEGLDYKQFVALLSGAAPSSEWHSPLNKTLTILGELRSLVNPDYHELQWEQTVRHVTDRRALLNLLGDFSSPLFAGENNGENGRPVAQPEIICTQPPGNTFVLWSLDTIALTQTRDQAELAGQDLLVEVATSREHIGQYVARKGGLPAYRDIAAQKLNYCSQGGLLRWQNTEYHINLSSTEWNNQLTILSNEARRFWLDSSISVDQSTEAIISALARL